MGGGLSTFSITDSSHPTVPSPPATCTTTTGHTTTGQSGTRKSPSPEQHTLTTPVVPSAPATFTLPSRQCQLGTRAGAYARGWGGGTDKYLEVVAAGLGGRTGPAELLQTRQHCRHHFVGPCSGEVKHLITTRTDPHRPSPQDRTGSKITHPRQKHSAQAKAFSTGTSIQHSHEHSSTVKTGQQTQGATGYHGATQNGAMSRATGCESPEAFTVCPSYGEGLSSCF